MNKKIENKNSTFFLHQHFIWKTLSTLKSIIFVYKLCSCWIVIINLNGIETVWITKQMKTIDLTVEDEKMVEKGWKGFKNIQNAGQWKFNFYLSSHICLLDRQLWF